MKYVDREITKKLTEYASLFPAVYLTGPRQSGKSVLLKRVFSEFRYANLEEKDVREFALADPRGFLNGLGSRTVIDEAQYAPELFSYIQSFIDERDETGMFILSGSQNFLMMKSIFQSLAGRVGILSLLPFSNGELASAGLLREDTNEWLFSGHYPRKATHHIKPTDFYPNYIKTYVERDVRLETGVQNIDKFSSFLRICAASAGTPVNMSQIGNAIDMDARTVASWLNILEESYLVFRLKPYMKKNVARFSKTPKLYFYDTGLLCSLLGIMSAAELEKSARRGVVFENAVIVEYCKKIYNNGGFPGDNTYFWRDSSAREREIDLVLEYADRLGLYEIKASQTAKTKFAGNMLWFEQNAGGIKCDRTVIYDGPNKATINGTLFVNRREVEY